MRHLLSLLLLCTALPLFGATVRFQQDGWLAGGPLTVEFTGADTNADGGVTLPELTRFEAVWRTPLNGETRWLLPDVQPDGFLFVDLDNLVLFVRNPEYSLVSTVLEGEALASVFDRFLFPVDSTSTPPSAVPEPGSVLLAGLGILALCLRSRWRARAR